MKRIILMFMIVVSIIVMAGCQEDENDGLKIAVSILPQAAFVDAVGGDLVDVTTIIPLGFSPENYEPSAKQIVDINESKIYFTMGVPAESANILPEINDMLVVHLEEEVEAVYEDLYFDHSHDEDDDHSEFSRDPHIWLSIKRVKVMVEVIANTLSDFDPVNEATYQSNATAYLGLLDDLDQDIQSLFDGKTMRTFIVYHPSYAYFADDYQLDMLALEEDGKEPSIAHLQELIDYARDNQIDRIYHQAEIDSERVESFRNDINGESITLYPLSYDYIDSMRDIAEKIEEGLYE